MVSVPRLLAFDTSTDTTSLALCGPEGTWVREMEGGAQASARLIPDILALLAEAGTSLNALDAIAYGRGPGAFTGLRTACSVAQGLAFGADKPVLPIDSLLLVAEDARLQLLSNRVTAVNFWVAMDARMDEIYAAGYRWQASGWQEVCPPALYAAAALSELWQARPPEVVAGSALTVFADRLPLQPSRQLPVAQSRATGLLAVAKQAWAHGASVPAAEALPLYLRDKVAQTTVEREQAKAAKAAQFPVST